jgi:hypothetical protein
MIRQTPVILIRAKPLSNIDSEFSKVALISQGVLVKSNLFVISLGLGTLSATWAKLTT